MSRSSVRSTPQQKNTAYKQACLSGPQQRLHTNESTQSQGQQENNNQHTCLGANETDLKKKSTCLSQCKPRSRRTTGQNSTKRTPTKKITKSTKSTGHKISKIKKKKYCPQNHTKLSKPITRYHNHASIRITPEKGHTYTHNKVFKQHTASGPCNHSAKPRRKGRP